MIRRFATFSPIGWKSKVIGARSLSVLTVSLRKLKLALIHLHEIGGENSENKSVLRG